VQTLIGEIEKSGLTHLPAMHLDLSDEEAAILIKELVRRSVAQAHRIFWHGGDD
jgi:hypothetical protein